MSEALRYLRQNAAAIWGFAVAVAFVPGVIEEAYVGRWAAIAIGIPLFGGISLFRFPFPLRIAIWLGLAWAAASLLISPVKLDATLAVFLILCVVGVAAVVSQMCEDDFSRLMRGLAFGIGVSSLVGVLSMMGIHLVDQGSTHYAGLFYNSEVFAEFAAPVFVWCVFRRQVTLAALCLFPLAFNGSRVAIAAVTIGLVYGIWCHSKRAGAIFGAIGLIAGIVLVSYLSHGRLIEAQMRLGMWTTAAASITALGHGLGWFQAAFPHLQFAHSDVLQAMAELGLGSLAFGAIPVYILWNAHGFNAERAAFVVICLEAVVSFALHTPASAFVAGALAGFLAGNCALLLDRQSVGGNTDGAGAWHTSKQSFQNFGARYYLRGRFPLRSAASPLARVDS